MDIVKKKLYIASGDYVNSRHTFSSIYIVASSYAEVEEKLRSNRAPVKIKTIQLMSEEVLI